MIKNKNKLKNKKNTALILIDLQNDFMPGGSLAVPEGNEVIGLANELQNEFNYIIATKDWHPENHSSFETLWPVHCVQNSYGAELNNSLNTKKITQLIYKGQDIFIDSYSAFFDNDHRKKTDLDHYLKTNHITDLYMMGLATEYCVKYSVLDACHLNYNVCVIKQGCRGLDKKSCELAFLEMKKAGAKII